MTNEEILMEIQRMEEFEKSWGFLKESVDDPERFAECVSMISILPTALKVVTFERKVDGEYQRGISVHPGERFDTGQEPFVFTDPEWLRVYSIRIAADFFSQIGEV